MCGIAIHLKFQCEVKCKERLAFSVVVRCGVWLWAYPGQAVDWKGIFAFDVYLYLAQSNHLPLFKKALKCPLILFKIIIKIVIYILYITDVRNLEIDCLQLLSFPRAREASRSPINASDRLGAFVLLCDAGSLLLASNSPPPPPPPACLM